MARNRENDPYAHNKLISDSTIVGEVYTKADFRLDGILKGILRTEGKLVIGKTGKVEGKVFCKTIDVFGYVEGEIHAEDILSMKAESHVKGNIYADKLVVELGCDFNGRCFMDGSYVEEPVIETEHFVAEKEPSVVKKNLNPVKLKQEVEQNSDKGSAQDSVTIQNVVMSTLESGHAPHQRKSIWRTL